LDPAAHESRPAASSPAAGAGAAEKTEGEVIAYDKQGRPAIIRQVDEEAGKGRTIVKNEDGSKSVFGESTVTSLSTSSEEKVEKWTGALSSLQLRGLVHEVGQRLLKSSQLYHKRLEELESMGEKLNFKYFGLTSDATEKEIDNAYRKLARRMHPDKNGGTEEAKKKFQDMKERYEALKKRWREGGDSQPEEEDSAGNEKAKEKEEEKEKGEEEEAQAKKAIEGDDAPNEGEEGGVEQKDKEKEKKGEAIEYDPKDKSSMVETVQRMVKQLRNIDTQMQALMKEVERARSQFPEEAEEAKKEEGKREEGKREEAEER